MGSLRTKVFLFFVSLLLLVQAVSLWTVYQANKKHEQQQIDYRLQAATSVFNTQYQERSYYLQAFAETAAKDYGLKDVFDADRRSFLIALNNHRKRIDADFAIAINRENLVTGQLIRRYPETKVSVGPDQGKPFIHPEWLGGLESTSHLYQQGEDVYQLSLAPLSIGQQVIGWIGYGYQINTQLAQNFADITGLSVEFFVNKQQEVLMPLAAAAPAGEQHMLNEGHGFAIVNGNVPDSIISTGTSVGTVEGNQLDVVIYGLRSNLLETLQGSWWRLMAFEGGIIFISLMSAYILAGSISNPVKRLVTQAQYIAKGNYDTSVDIAESNELGQLAKEFTQMQQAVLVREQKIRHQLFYNPLTNLPNRNSLSEELDRLYDNTKQAFALLHCDVRRTRAVNDTLGYEAGNLMIFEVGRRLANLNAGVRTYHLGADEFAMIIFESQHEQIARWQEKIEKAMDEPLSGEGTLLHLQLHTGYAVAPEDADNGENLLQKADTALSHGKREMQVFQQYRAEMDADASRRLELVNDLKVAIEENQLCLFYQPKLDIASGQIHHLEALVRWMHPTQGMIPPDAFINIAEQTGQIDALTDWVLKEAARQYTEWTKSGLELSIAVNISAENLRNHAFTKDLSDIWAQYSLPDNALSLEVTESAVVIDPASAIRMLYDIRAQGIKLSIDDYGTGYSSLGQLKQLPVHELKIDRSFIDKVFCDPDDQIIVRSTIRMAHDMGLSVVAEGIEDAQTLEWLADNHCNLAQGYFISRPLPADELIRWLMESEFKPTQSTELHA